MHIVAWNYRTALAHKADFEHEYGPKGSWATFFRISQAYKGSFLYKLTEEPDTYMLLDTWTSQQAYENFLESNKKEYAELSKKLEHLYLQEEKTGTYQLIE
ncbi:hypothetical protein GCM10009122_19180 [Fulvivirga kasyanovii]|uniref:ABM domain-containing protein n=1 Tax=Fulvivirga kasyanovii TaxID=396812 RepID=A0ABW9RJT1_9BACT|nr:hypothetical protein [Fulvivirga kasyanovii]MTI24196.1 hypothetical protein [Fulvivirga kasyanovii]